MKSINTHRKSKQVCKRAKRTTRFVLGFLDDIEVLGSNDFKTHLNKIA